MLERKAVAQKRKAVEPAVHFCHILKKEVTLLTEYLDYKSSSDKGQQGSSYCSNILPCYHDEVKCMYSGISPLFRNPFSPTDSESAEEENPEINL